MMDNQLAIFEQKPIRRTEYNGDIYFSIVDIIEVLTDSPKPTAYWNKVRKNILKENDVYPFWIKLKFRGSDGKNYPSDATNTEGVLRVLMSVPSPKAEPLKLWLAQVGKQAILETENPELAIERAAELYKAKGYPSEWVTHRLKTIEVRKELTDEWKARQVKEGQEYAVLTATIAQNTFGLKPSEHAKLKGLDRQNLRDHMTPLELIFTALSEEASRQITVEDDAQGFNENLDAAQKGGNAAGEALKRFEEVRKKGVVSSDNFLGLKGTTDALPEGNNLE